MTQRAVYVLPGYANSGPGHWQTRWEESDPSFVRVEMPDWDRPVCDAWCDALDAAVAAHDGRNGPLVMAAHSLGCLTVAHWATRRATPEARAKVAGALLVAVPDPHGAGFPGAASGYGTVAAVRLPFASIVVASSDDSYGSLDFSRRCAEGWGSRFVDIGPRGHINAQSGLGDWEQGRRWLASLEP